jgi:hypothetical protein
MTIPTWPVSILGIAWLTDWLEPSRWYGVRTALCTTNCNLHLPNPTCRRPLLRSMDGHIFRVRAQVMVAGAVARPRATPEPRVRAFPSRGSSGYGRLVLGTVLYRTVQCLSTGPLS